MGEIPVTFESKGKIYHGHFVPVGGAGFEPGSMFFLIINRRHRGQMFLAEHNELPPGMPVDLTKPRKYKWRFTSQTGEFEELVDFFEDTLISWYQ